MDMLYKYDGCFSGCGKEARDLESFVKPLLTPLNKSLHSFKEKFRRDEFPFLNLPYQHADLQQLKEVALRLQDDFSDIIVLGTGGSSLGAQAVCALKPWSSPRLHYLDNIDPHYFRGLFETINPRTTAFLVISKSGYTAETLFQFIVCLKKWQKEVGVTSLKNHFIIITEDTNSPLKKLAEMYHIPFFPHHPKIGGRFSVLSLVGLLPAMIAGINVNEIHEGATRVLDKVLDSPDASTLDPALGAAFCYRMDRDFGKTSMVLMPYVDQLSSFSRWYCQLWAESLGKKGKGSTPIAAKGTADQHSIFQLFLDGPKDKFFTILGVENRAKGNVALPEFTQHHPGLKFLENMHMGDLMAAEQQATIDTLVSNGCPVRLIEMKEINSYFMGALLMHFFLETLFAADLYKTDPFGQPAVEEGKILTRSYMEGFRKNLSPSEEGL